MPLHHVLQLCGYRLYLILSFVTHLPFHLQKPCFPALISLRAPSPCTKSLLPLCTHWEGRSLHVRFAKSSSSTAQSAGRKWTFQQKPGRCRAKSKKKKNNLLLPRVPLFALLALSMVINCHQPPHIVQDFSSSAFADPPHRVLICPQGPCVMLCTVS